VLNGLITFIQKQLDHFGKILCAYLFA